MQAAIKAHLEKQGYRVIGDNEHSACKICTYTKKGLTNQGSCYKQKFYGIDSHRCVQMTPVFTCNNKCVFCWRDMSAHTGVKMDSGIDEPDMIIDGAIDAQRSLLNGYGGNALTDPQKFAEMYEPKHFAISLTGEPTLYPKLSELIEALHKRGISTFIVSNGLIPDKIRKLASPTQLYISVDAHNKEAFSEIDRPILKDAWERLLETLDVLKAKRNETRTVLRFTIIKGMNNYNTHEWAQMIKRAKPMFVEIKSYSWIGNSQERLERRNMMEHDEIVAFSKEIAKHAGYVYIDDMRESRVALLGEKDFKDRKIDFEKWEHDITNCK